MKRLLLFVAALIVSCGASASAQPSGKPRNVVIFVPDGLRAAIVDQLTAPTMFSVAQTGVRFVNSPPSPPPTPPRWRPATIPATPVISAT
jgi:alkaline phosphatase